MNERHGFWLHHIRKSKSSVNGFFYLPECDCSVCGCTMRMEKPICPNCKAIMDQAVPEEIKEEIKKYTEERNQGALNDSEFMRIVRSSLEDDTAWK